jgi:hypothetical protein
MFFCTLIITGISVRVCTYVSVCTCVCLCMFVCVLNTYKGLVINQNHPACALSISPFHSQILAEVDLSAGLTLFLMTVCSLLHKNRLRPSFSHSFYSMSLFYSRHSVPQEPPHSVLHPQGSPDTSDRWVTRSEIVFSVVQGTHPEGLQPALLGPRTCIFRMAKSRCSL